MAATRTFPFAIVDVFAERPLAGNQLAVVQAAAGLSDDEMQAIALETNFSETTFVTENSGARAAVRIFTPAFELPFAGHPTLGTAWELTGGRGEIILDLPAGPVPVHFEGKLGWMTPPGVAFTGGIDAQTAAELVGLKVADFVDELPLELAEVGPRFVLLPVKNLRALKKARLNADLHRRLLNDNIGVQCVFLFTDDTRGKSAQSDSANGPADYAARMFFESAGVREDPATGSANAALAAYLYKHRGALGRVVVAQGVEINRPSRLYLNVGKRLQVGGKVQPVVRGELKL